MNARHPSGYTPDYDAHEYDAYSTGAYPTVGTTYADDATGTYPYIPQQSAGPYGQPYEPAEPAYEQTAYGYGYGYPSGDGQAAAYGQVAPQAYDTGAYETGAYDTGAATGYDPNAYGTAPTAAGATYYDTGTYEAGALWQPEQQQAGYPQQQDWDSGAYPAYGYGYGYDASGDTGVYEQVPAYQAQPYPAPGYPQTAGYEQPPVYEQHAPAYETPAYGTPAYDQGPYGQAGYDTTAYQEQVHEQVQAPVGPGAGIEPEAPGAYDDSALLLDELDVPADDEPVRHDYAADSVPAAARSRRRKPARRSALLTVAVPSVAVMGVAAVGAAAIGGVGAAQDTSKTSADGASDNAPTTQLDRQLTGVSRDADDFATRANRAQERVDLKDRQAAAKRAKDAAAARKEALRPKFVLPVKQKGLSALFGQSGEHWMALHTGIDFPVQVGTPVEAVTDGTVRTQWNSSYGNMAIVTAPDGTETWYCHLSSTKIRSGSVKAGTVIAYSGNTGNTTGPHLHLEVRPHGGSPIDPLPWLLSHGLDPR